MCGRVMRNDNLKRHPCTKLANTENEEKSGKVHQLQRQATIEGDQDYHDRSLENQTTESRDQVTAEIHTSVEQPIKTPDFVNASLEYELVRDNETYKKNIAIGEQIFDVLLNGKIVEKSLTKQHKFCFELFQAQRPTVDVANAELRLWQEQLLDIINEDEMNDRKIIWVKGEKGNEGKSWFQSYVQSLHGAHRVARFDITNKTADLLHIMRRSALATTDIFLFNQQRCISSEECCYSLLEMIKDGYASAPKFHGALLQIKTPNVVVVFSNHNPRVHALSKNRWKIVFITNDGLTANHENWLWDKQRENQQLNENSSRFARGKFTKGHDFENKDKRSCNY